MIPRHSSNNLSIKYEINYSKLEAILPQHIAGETRENFANEIIFEKYLDSFKEQIPAGLHLAEVVAAADKEDSVKAQVGCVNFIASLARVDGCILLSCGLNVRGFGVEITCKNDPPAIFTAGDERASKAKLRSTNFSHFGTRHRSMMRYCYANPGSVGFVISQDGDVRAIMRVGKLLVIWENIRLQDIEVVKHRKNS